MNKREFHIGPGAASLLLVVVVLSMSVLGMLALLNARSDANLSARSVAVTKEIYALNCSCEESIAMLDGLLAECAKETMDDYLVALEKRLPENMILQENKVLWQEKIGSQRALCCEVEIAPPGTFPRLQLTACYLQTNIDLD